MVDIAYLGIQVDSKPAVRGAKDLNVLTRSANRADVANQNLAASTNRVGKASGVARGGMRNLGMQLNQVAQVGGMTGNWMSAIAVQLPDMLLGFGGLGIAIGIVAGAMIPLISSLGGTSKGAEEAEKRIDDLSAAIKAYSASVDASKMSTSEMVEEYGQLSEAAAEAIEIQKTLNRIKAEIRANETVSNLFAADGVSEALSDVRGLQEIITNLSSEDVPELQRGLASFRVEQAQVSLIDAYAQLGDEIGITGDAASDLSGKLSELGGAEGASAQLAIMQDMQSIIVDSSGGLSEMDTVTREFSATLAAAINEMLDLGVAINRDTDGTSALELAALAAAGGFEAINSALPAISANLSTLVQQAWDFAGALGASEKGYENRSKQAYGLYGFTRGRAPSNAPSIAPVSSRRGGGGSRGRSSGAGRPDPMLAEANRLFEETRTEAEKYQAEIEKVNELHRKFGTIVTDEVRGRALSGLKDDFKELSESAVFFGETVDKEFQDGFIDNIIDGVDAVGLLERALKKAALQLLLFNNGPFSKGGGGLSGILSSLLSFDGGGFTGSGSRSGGADGKGGFLAIMHPNETVIDHTKTSNRNQSGQISVVVRMEQDGNMAGYIESVSGPVAAKVVQAGLQQYSKHAAPQVQKNISNDPRRIG